MNDADEKRVKTLIEQYGAILQSKMGAADQSLAREIVALKKRIADLENALRTHTH
jgi:polyhydroxyalkanoate synthesis regulator phasin